MKIRKFYEDQTPEQLRDAMQLLVDFAVTFAPENAMRIYQRIGALAMAADTYDMTASSMPGTPAYVWYQAALDVLVETDDLRRAR